MFDILMYLFENYIQGDTDIMINHAELTDELTRAGFHEDNIGSALYWLEKLAELQHRDQPYVDNTRSDAVRIYTREEQSWLGRDGIGFIMFLEQSGILNADSREMVLDQLRELGNQPVHLDDLKWVILLVLFNARGCEAAYSKMETLLFEQPEGPLQ